MFALQTLNDNTSDKCSVLKNILTTTKNVFKYVRPKYKSKMLLSGP